MTAFDRSLPVLMPTVPGQRWSCHSCGNCCRTLVGHLTDSECAQLDAHPWGQELGAQPYVRAGGQWVLNKRPDGACVFLDHANRCRIHARFGESAKPLACRIFPFSVRPTERGWQASLRFDCPSVTAGSGEPISARRAWLGELASELAPRATLADDPVELQPGVRAAEGEAEVLLERLSRWFAREDFRMATRLIGAARLTSTLHTAKLAATRGRRFRELLDLLLEALPADCAAAPTTPSPRQSAMLRQLAFAHAEHVALSEVRGSFLARLRKKCQQLGSARRFLAGRGPVPSQPGLSGAVTFEQVDAVAPNRDRVEAVDDLTRRYVQARLSGRSVFGGGYYNWSAVRGLGACWLSLAAAGWLARRLAAGAGRDAVSFDDVAAALGIVDRAATRLPALGAFAERARADYLLGDDGVARLLHRYGLVTT